MEWFEVEITAASILSEAISNHLFELGALGISEEGTENSPILSAYFENSHSEKVRQSLVTFCDSLVELFPGEKKPEIRFRNIRDTGWSEKYKEFYKAQKLSHDFFLLPAWDKTSKVPSEMIPIRMEPGQAFGTGLHPSTRLSLRLIEYVFEKSFEPQKLRVIDVGTGTGILAIAAQKLGAKQVWGTDIDPVAVETAKENIKINECPKILISTSSLSEFKEPFDLVISNILLEAHVQLATEYHRLTKPGGFLIVSGLLGNQRRQTIELLEAQGFGVIVSEAFQEWAAFLFARKG